MVKLLFTLFFFIFAITIISGCKDRVNNCRKAAAYCKWPSLVQTLKENCELTCNYCKQLTKGGSKHKGPKTKPTKNKNLPKYKLHYFAFRLRAEPVRLLFHYKNVTFEDYRIQTADWPKLKSNYPNGQVPALEIDGKMLMQSGAIYRYVGNKFDMFGRDEIEASSLDSIAELHRELFDSTVPFIQAKIGVTKDDPDLLFKTQFVPAIDKIAPQLVKLLQQSGSGYFTSKLSWVDFYVTESILTFKGYAPAVMNKYPELLDHNDRIYALPQLKKYLNSRPSSPM